MGWQPDLQGWRVTGSGTGYQPVLQGGTSTQVLLTLACKRAIIGVDGGHQELVSALCFLWAVLQAGGLDRERCTC